MAFTALRWSTTTYCPSRALSHTPRILLLDEPLGALDALTRLEMQSLIERLWKEQGFTAILVTHDVSEAVQLADRIILLDKGQIAQSFKLICRVHVKRALLLLSLNNKYSMPF
jgi:ABC-type nitrate/sulfonate/bicarbonate transport system ATPase subunit